MPHFPPSMSHFPPLCEKKCDMSKATLNRRCRQVLTAFLPTLLASSVIHPLTAFFLLLTAACWGQTECFG
jgi:hypothetical protein